MHCLSFSVYKFNFTVTKTANCSNRTQTALFLVFLKHRVYYIRLFVARNNSGTISMEFRRFSKRSLYDFMSQRIHAQHTTHLRHRRPFEARLSFFIIILLTAMTPERTRFSALFSSAKRHTKNFPRFPKNYNLRRTFIVEKKTYFIIRFNKMSNLFIVRKKETRKNQFIIIL